jgi:4-oxalocrotonate tautomerase
MPLMRISLRTGKSAAYKGAIVEATYQAMRAAWSIPEHDRFAVVSEHDATTLEYDSGYLDIARTDDIVIIQITANDTRTTAQKSLLQRSGRPAARRSRHPQRRRLHQPR